MRSSKKKFLLFLIFVVVSVVVCILSGYFGLNSSSIDLFVSLNSFFAGFLYSLVFIVLASFSFSVSVMTGLGALIFPLPELVVYAMVGILGSSVVDFYIARKLGRDYVQKYLKRRGDSLEKFDEVVEKSPFKTIFILSTIFFVPPTVPNFLGGIMKINLRDYSFATFLGNLPNTFFTVYLINGIIYSNYFQIYFSIVCLVVVTAVALFFYRGEIGEILRISFPRIFGRLRNSSSLV